MDTVDNSEEIWKDIAGWEGLYAVSNAGRVKRILKNSEIILKPQRSTAGYPINALWRNNKRRNYFIHVLVAETFLPPRPTPSHDVNHIDANRLNPHVDNLEWV